MTRPYDEAFIQEAAARLKSIPDEKQPEWGGMTLAQMYGHLRLAFSFSLGKEPPAPDEGNFFVRSIIGPLVLNGILKIPRNTSAPKLYLGLPTATADDVVVEMRAFQEAYTSGTLPNVPHPFFGPFGAKGWAKLHVIHCDHHLRQFGA